MSGQSKQNREAPASPSPTPASDESLRADVLRVDGKLDSLANGMVTTCETIAAMGTSMTTALDAIAELRGLVLEMRDELATLRADARHGVTMQAPRALTRVEVATVLAEKPAQQFIVIAGFPALNLNAGDRFDARTRFARLDDLPLHVERGLKITIPPQA